MMIQIIVCCDEQLGIGYKNDLLFKKLDGDMAHFKQQTFDTVCLMGRKTWDSLPFKLPNRINAVISRYPSEVESKIYKDEIQHPDIFISHRDPIKTLREIYPDKDISIIGGSSIYNQFMNKIYIQEVWITRVHATCTADCWFPEIDKELFFLKEQFEHSADSRNEFSFTIEHWVNKKYHSNPNEYKMLHPYLI